MSDRDFSFCVPLGRLGTVPQPFQLDANEAARAALAQRFGLLAVHGLSARLEASRKGSGALLAGEFEAEVVQACIVSGEPVPVRLHGRIDLRFEPDAAEPGQEIELEADALDVVPLEDDSLDLGEAVAQSLYLALDPYPRAPDVVLEASRRHLATEEDAAEAQARAKADASPFAKLRRP